MAVEVVKQDDGTIKIIKPGSTKECCCTLEKVLSEKSKVEGILDTFDVKAHDERSRMITDFDNRMAVLKSSYQARLTEINTVIQKAIAAGCVLPE